MRGSEEVESKMEELAGRRDEHEKSCLRCRGGWISCKDYNDFQAKIDALEWVLGAYPENSGRINNL